MEMLPNNGSDQLFYVIMAKYEELSWEFSHMHSLTITYHDPRERTRVELLNSVSRTKHLIIDFMNFARFHEGFYQQVQPEYLRFINNRESCAKVGQCLRTLNSIQRMWFAIQKGMVDQKLVVLKGV